MTQKIVLLLLVSAEDLLGVNRERGGAGGGSRLFLFGNVLRDIGFSFGSGQERVEVVREGHWATAFHLNGLSCSACMCVCVCE